MSAHRTRPRRFPGGSVTLRIPASTSNLGSGFDTLGLALRLYQFVRLTRAASSRITLTHLPNSAQPIKGPALEFVETAAQVFFKQTRQKRFGVRIEQWGEVPFARGLGASAVLRVGVIAGLNELAGTRLPRQALLELITELEGHPDNASPAILGGFTVSGRVNGQVRCLSFDVSSRLKFVALFPSFGIDTKHARRLMPASYSRRDTAHALNRAALITAAFSSGNYEALRGAFDDRMHQPYREQLIPELFRVIRAGERAGAIGGFLSGSGSAIICMTLDNADAIARAMQRQLPSSTTKILIADNHGFTVASRP